MMEKQENERRENHLQVKLTLFQNEISKKLQRKWSWIKFHYPFQPIMNWTEWTEQVISICSKFKKKKKNKLN